jgi:hypothetical protein
LVTSLESDATGKGAKPRGGMNTTGLPGNSIVPIDCALPDDPIGYWLLVDGSFGSEGNLQWEDARLSQARKASSLIRDLSAHSETLQLCQSNTRSVVFFESETKNSFYHPDLRRTVFINWRPIQSIHHVIEEFIHQSVHSVIDEISTDGSLFVSGEAGGDFDPDHTHMINAGSETFVRFHSMATLALISEGFFDWPGSGSATERAVVLGRLSFAFQKLSYDLQYFVENMWRLAPLGAAFLKTTLAFYQRVLAIHQETFQRHDMSDQPYVFDEATFLMHNAGMRPGAA